MYLLISVLMLCFRSDDLESTENSDLKSTETTVDSINMIAGGSFKSLSIITSNISLVTLGKDFNSLSVNIYSNGVCSLETDNMNQLSIHNLMTLPCRASKSCDSDGHFNSAISNDKCSKFTNSEKNPNKPDMDRNFKSEASLDPSRPENGEDVGDGKMAPTHNPICYTKSSKSIAEKFISKRKKSANVNIDRKAAKTLSAILLALILSWSPYMIFTTINTFDNTIIPTVLYYIGE